MSKKIAVLGWFVAVVSSVGLVPRPAFAQLSECGNVNLSGEVECDVTIEGGCEVICDTSNMELSCDGKLRAGCKDIECDVDIDVGCTGECTAECTAECEIEPGEFDCEGSCQGSCTANCDAECEASDNRASCKASCEATCSGECSASCSGTPVEVDCSGKCVASCEGQCKAKAKVDCQAECYADGYLECKTNMQDVCEGQCTRPEGVITCDGQFVSSEHVDECVDAIQTALGIEVEVHGSAEGECSGNQCSGKAEGSVSCAMAPVGSSNGESGLIVLGAVMGLSLTLRRRAERR